MQAKHKPLMQVRIDLRWKMLLTLLIMGTMTLLVQTLDIPNPNMILTTGLIFCSAVFGFGGGAIAAGMMFLYTLYFFSTDHSLTAFSPENLEKVWVSLFGIVTDMLLVCTLKSAELRAFRGAEELTRRLSAENSYLQEASRTDGLTGICNRLALNDALETCGNQDVTVMMVDLDDFKLINDTLGHEEGDRILREVGGCLAEQFGREQCYRYGGDEFLVICPAIPPEVFSKKRRAFLQERPLVTLAGKTLPVGCSTGCVSRQMREDDTLEELILLADRRMYAAKREKK